MNSTDQKVIVDFYNQSFAEFGNDARSVHWSGKVSQDARFEVLINIAPLAGMSILDVGCGLGDLYKFLITKKIPIDYFGIDIVPNFIARSQERFPDARFELMDASLITETYDYILASGAFSLTTADSKNYYFSIIRNLFKHAKYGFAFNMLNADTHQSNETYFAYNMDEVERYCKTLTSKVTIISGYLPQDFTVYMYKEEK